MPDQFPGLDQIIQSSQTGTRARVVSGLDANPDDAARTVDFEQSTGVPAQVIGGDLENFDKKQRSWMAQQLVMGNPQLRAYVQAHPLAASVSNDDWGTLDKLSQSASQTALAIGGSAKRGFEEAGVPSEEYAQAQQKFGAVPGALIAGVFRTLTLPGQIFGGAAAGAGEAWAQAMDKLGFNKTPDEHEASARHFEDFAQGIGVAMMGEGASPLIPGKVWIKAGEEPPAGVDPKIDQTKAQVNDLLRGKVEADLTNAQVSTTRERSPELFQRFTEQHYGRTTIGIAPDAALALYGDKVPTPDDGLLGWVPGIADKLERARSAGTDVEVPLADWVARVDPAVAKALEDHIRAWPGGITAEEAKAEPVPPAPQVTPAEPPPPAPGTFRVYHGSAEEANPAEYEAWVASTPEYAKNYRGGPNKVWWTDVPLDELPMATREQWEINGIKPSHFQLTQARSATLRPLEEAKPVPAADPTSPLGQVRKASGTEPIFGYIQAQAAGLDARSGVRLEAAMKAEQEADLAAATRLAEKEQKKRQTQEWKDNEAVMRDQTEQLVRQRPDVAADLLVGSGELQRMNAEGKLVGVKARQRVPLRAEDLTPEQKAMLPDHYYSAGGLPIDEVARELGFGSGDAMVDALGAYHAAKEGRTPQEMLKYVIDSETQTAMEAKHGPLAQNILDGARDQALSEASLNRLAEETYAVGIQAGSKVPIDRVGIRAEEERQLGKTIASEVNKDKIMATMGRHWQEAVRSLIAGKPTEAFISLQRRQAAAERAALVKKLEEEQAAFSKVLARYRKSFDPAKHQDVEPNASIFVRDILAKVGLRNGMPGPNALPEAIQRSGYADLADWITKTEATYKMAGLELPVPDFLLEKGPSTPIDKMTVDEWREVRNAVTSIDKFGRDYQKVEVAGQKVDRDDWMGRANKQLAERFEPIPYEPNKKAGLTKVVESAVSTMTNAETVFRRFDGRDPHGLFTETFVKPGSAATSYEAVLQRETSKLWRELRPIKDGHKLLDSPLIDPRTNQPIKGFNRSNLAVLISNMGNAYNWKVLTEGWKVDPDFLWSYIEQHSTVEELERAQEMGKIFDGKWEKSQTMYEGQYGVAPFSVEPRPFTMHGRQWEGWFHPVIHDAELSKFLNKMPDTGPEVNFWPSPSNPYIKRRTGAIAPIDLTYANVPLRLGMMDHDIATKPFVANASRLLNDTRLRQGITTHYGKIAMDELDAWLKRIAGDQSYNTSAVKMAERISGELRQNVISTQIAFNVGTVMKHFFTAWAYSARELGPNLPATVPKFFGVTAQVLGNKYMGLFKSAAMELYGKSPYLGESMWKFAKDNSEELQRRERNYLDTMVGATRQLEEKQNLRLWIAQQGAKWVGYSDLLSAVPLWIAKYREALETNGGDFGAATADADLAVRNAHGSTAVSNLPSIASGKGILGPWMTSLYGFMGTTMQRRIEMLHDVNDAWKLGMNGEIKASVAKWGEFASSYFVYVFWMGLIEQQVQGLFIDDKRSIGQRLLLANLGGLANAVIGLRDVYYDVMHGEGSAGLISTPINDTTNLTRDVEKHSPLGRAHVGRLLQDSCTEIGDVLGLCPKHIGTAARYGVDIFNSFQRPRGPGDWFRGTVSGQQKLRVVK